MLAITIGNFDGVHQGHAALVRAARRRAGASGRTIAVTFEPHPAERLRPTGAPPRLTSSAERQRWLRAAGADEVLELDPTRELLSLAPEAFVDELRSRLPFDAVIEGEDFRFGRGRAGTAQELVELGARGGFLVDIVPPIEVVLTDCSIVRASSTLVRWLLAHGRVRDAALVLGRPYGFEAETTRGEQRGRTIGVPTMNLAPLQCPGDGDDVDRRLLPADGVYAGSAELPDGLPRAAAISVGTKPTFGVQQRVCEVHIVDAELPLDWYAFPLRVDFRHWIRPQARFDGLDALRARIRRDIDLTRDWVVRSMQDPLISAESAW